MILPSVNIQGHCSGSKQKDLLDANQRALYAVETAIAALKEAAPKPRDYYPQGVTAPETATREHWVRVRALQSVHSELTLLIDHLLKKEAA